MKGKLFGNPNDRIEDRRDLVQSYDYVTYSVMEEVYPTMYKPVRENLMTYEDAEFWVKNQRIVEESTKHYRIQRIREAKKVEWVNASTA